MFNFYFSLSAEKQPTWFIRREYWEVLKNFFQLLRNVTFLNPTSRLKLTGKSVENLPFYLGSCSSSVEYNSFLYEFTAHQPSEIDNLVQVQQARLFRVSEVWEVDMQDKHRCCSFSDLCRHGLLSFFEGWIGETTSRSQL